MEVLKQICIIFSLSLFYLEWECERYIHFGINFFLAIHCKDFQTLTRLFLCNFKCYFIAQVYSNIYFNMYKFVVHNEICTFNVILFSLILSINEMEIRCYGSCIMHGGHTGIIITDRIMKKY